MNSSAEVNAKNGTTGKPLYQIIISLNILYQNHLDNLIQNVRESVLKV